MAGHYHDGSMMPQDADSQLPLDSAPSVPIPDAIPPGLTTAEATDRLLQDGPNAIGGGSRRTLAPILVSQVASPLVLILVAASLVSLLVGDAVTTAIILAIVVMSATQRFVQEARSESAVAALQARLTLRATVVRDGVPSEVPIHDVVRDDLVVLGAGDIVPADGRVIEADHLYVDEASLTGESAPSLKGPRDGELDPASGDDRDGPFWRSRPSKVLVSAIVGALAAAVIIPISPLGPMLGFEALPPVFWLLLVSRV